MNIETILPLIGVAVGWLLNEAGFLFRTRRDEKKVIGKAILKLLELRYIIFQLLERVHAIKRFAGKSVLSEEDRNRLPKLPDISSATSKTYLDALLAEVASIDPILSFELEIYVRPIALFANEGMEMVLKHPDRLKRPEPAIASTELVLEELLTYTRKLILRLIRRKSWYQWMQAQRYFRHEKENFLLLGRGLKVAQDMLRTFEP